MRIALLDVAQLRRVLAVTHRRDQYREGKDAWLWQRKQRPRFEWRRRRIFLTINEQIVVGWRLDWPKSQARRFDLAFERMTKRWKLAGRRGFGPHIPSIL